MNINKTGETTPQNVLKVNDNGDIELNSIKNGSVFEKAREFDKDGNGLLENKEINDFLKKYNNFAISSCDGYSVYYEEKDQSGKTSKKCLSLKDNSQQTFYYKDGKPVKCILTMASGEEHHMDLVSRDSKYNETPSNPDTWHNYQLNDKNAQKFIRLGEGKTPVFSNPIQEFAYRLFNWDWD